jgi:hypothetical protein
VGWWYVDFLNETVTVLLLVFSVVIIMDRPRQLKYDEEYPVEEEKDNVYTFDLERNDEQNDDGSSYN